MSGIHASHADEESLRVFLNSVICKCLGDDPDSSYILSIYVNQQKCFAFVELNSIELTTACLELDGILYLNSPLKILRANEYKPELLPPPTYPPVKLNMSGLLFGPTSTHPNNIVNNPGSNSMQHHQPIAAATVSYVNEPQFDQLIKYCSVNAVHRGSIAIVGFPYDDPNRKFGSSTIGMSQSNLKPPQACGGAPRSIRTALRKFQSGVIVNAEYNVDLSNVKIVDVGDIQGGMPILDAFKSLTEVVAELIQRGALPIIIGGSFDISPYIASGLMFVASNPIGCININPSIDASLLDDHRFYSQNRNTFPPSFHCDGRFVHYAAQV